MTKDAQFNIRLPADLKVSLEEAAVSNKRSTSAETISRLQDSFKPSLDREATEEWVKLVHERDRLKEDLEWAMKRMFDAMQLLSEAQAMNARLLGDRADAAPDAQPSAPAKKASAKA